MIPHDRRPELERVLGVLHAKKSAVYGDAWRKRGEVLIIFPNVARNYDRLEVTVESGELDLAARGALDRTVELLLDTLADLAIYAVKYLTFLAETQLSTFPGQVSAAACADFDGALRTVLAGQGLLWTASEDRTDPRARFGEIAAAMQPLETLLLGPPTADVPGEKAAAIMAVAAGSLALLDCLAVASPELRLAFVREVEHALSARRNSPGRAGSAWTRQRCASSSGRFVTASSTSASASRS